MFVSQLPYYVPRCHIIPAPRLLASYQLRSCAPPAVRSGQHGWTQSRCAHMLPFSFIFFLKNRAHVSLMRSCKYNAFIYYVQVKNVQDALSSFNFPAASSSSVSSVGRFGFLTG